MISIDFDVVIFKESDNYVAYSTQLDISSCGHDALQARNMLKSAVRLFLEESDRQGHLKQILEESGYTLDDKGKWVAPQIISTEMVSL